MEEQVLPSITAEDKIKYEAWWSGLSDEWKKAFNETLFQRGPVTRLLTEEEMHQVWHSEALRFAGPKALYPNMSFEIGNLDGVKDLINLKTLAAIDSGIVTLKPIAKLKKLEGLFVFNNELTSLEGVEKMKNLKQLYIQDNYITSLEPLKKLTKLETVYACRNKFKSLKGLNEKHSKKLTMFRILPNDKLPQKEIIKMENKIGIRCLQG